MSTAHEEVASVATSDAMDLLSCFHSGVEQFVYDLAKAEAKRRNPNRVPIRIEARDIRTASQRVVDAIQKMVSEGGMPEEMTEAVEAMNACCNS